MPDQKQIVAQYCRYVGEIKTGKNIKQMVRRALQYANSDPKGPVYLMGAREVMEEEIEPYTLNPEHWLPLGRAALPSDAVVSIGDALVHAAQPLVITGYSGRNHAVPQALVDLANTIKGLRVLDTGGCDMCFPADHPSWLGLKYGADDSIHTADVILVIDCDVPWVNTLCKPSESAKIIHLDVDPMKEMMPLFYLNATHRYRVDAFTAISQIVSHLNLSSDHSTLLSSSQFQQRWTALETAHNNLIHSFDQRAITPENNTVTTAHLCSTLRQMVPSDTLFVIEAVTNSTIVAEQIRATLPGQWTNCGGGGLGWSGGAALGIKLAVDYMDRDANAKERRMVVQIVGDGSFLFSVPSSVYWISHRYGIPILTIVLNNKGTKHRSLYSRTGTIPLILIPSSQAGTLLVAHCC